MDFANGYRLKIKSVRDLSGVLEGFRTDALKILAREVGRLVAADAVLRFDLATLGKSSTRKRSSPLKDANEKIGNAYLGKGDGMMDLDCEIVIHLVNDAVLASFTSGAMRYRKLWESRKEVIRWGWAPGAPRPRGLSEQRWKTREAFWKATVAKPGIRTGLRLSLVDERLPQIGWNGVRRYIPTLEKRIKAVVEAHDQPSLGGRATDIADVRRKLATTLVRDVQKSHLMSYVPDVRATESTRASAHPKGTEAKQASTTRSGIDHADIVRSSDGRVFVAVPYVGLDTEDRVFLQVADNEVVITQNAIQYGHVGNVSRSAVDLLRDCKTVTLVEVEVSDGKRLLRAKHVVIVKDMSITQNVSRLFGKWRLGGNKQSRDDGEIKQWDSQ